MHCGCVDRVLTVGGAGLKSRLFDGNNGGETSVAVETAYNCVRLIRLPSCFWSGIDFRLVRHLASAADR